MRFSRSNHHPLASNPLVPALVFLCLSLHCFETMLDLCDRAYPVSAPAFVREEASAADVHKQALLRLVSVRSGIL